MMDDALVYEIETRIPELKGSVYPTHAPENITKPILVYTRINTEKVKTYDGFLCNEALSYMFSIMAKKNMDMRSLTDKVEAFLMSIIRVTIGNDTDNVFVQDITINNRTATWENELGVNRGIIDFTIYH